MASSFSPTMCSRAWLTLRSSSRRWIARLNRKPRTDIEHSRLVGRRHDESRILRMSGGIIRATMLKQNRWIMIRHWFAPAVKKVGLAMAMGLILAASQGHGQQANGPAGSWDQPVASLADQISGILGPGQA